MSVALNKVVTPSLSDLLIPTLYSIFRNAVMGFSLLDGLKLNFEADMMTEYSMLVIGSQ